LGKGSLSFLGFCSDSDGSSAVLHLELVFSWSISLLPDVQNIAFLVGFGVSPLSRDGDPPLYLWVSLVETWISHNGCLVNRDLALL
jgi:hypothetical protein